MVEVDAGHAHLLKVAALAVRPHDSAGPVDADGCPVQSCYMGAQRGGPIDAAHPVGPAQAAGAEEVPSDTAVSDASQAVTAAAGHSPRACPVLSS